MTEVVRLVICGAAGRMGRALLESVREFADLEISAALVRPGSVSAAAPVHGEFIFATSLAIDAPVDAIVDFSGAQGFDAALSVALERGVALVSGSTGLSAAQDAAMHSASRSIPVLWAANFSVGVAVLSHLVAEAARLLPDWDCEILEAHHRLKRDAPSGTALMLGERINEARGGENSQLLIERSGLRPTGPVGYSVVRGGDIVGEHDVRLLGLGERLELVHRATNRNLFARGALWAARWLSGKPAGSYTMSDVLGLGTR